MISGLFTLALVCCTMLLCIYLKLSCILIRNSEIRIVHSGSGLLHHVVVYLRILIRNSDIRIVHSGSGLLYHVVVYLP